MTTDTTTPAHTYHVGDWIRGAVCVAEVLEVYEAKGQSNGVPFVLPMMRIQPVLHREERRKCPGCSETIQGRAMLPDPDRAETYTISQGSPHWRAMTDRQRRRAEDIVAEGRRQRDGEPSLFDGVAGQLPEPTTKEPAA